MRSGLEVLGSLDQGLVALRSEIQEIEQRVQRTSGELVQLQRQEAQLFKELARLRLGQFASSSMLERVDEAERSLGGLLAERDAALSDLVEELGGLESRRATLELERNGLLPQVEEAQEKLDDAEAEAQEKLGLDEAYGEHLGLSKTLDRQASFAEKKAEMAERDRLAKGQPYEADRLFVYLWERGYGTSRYSANPLIRYLDGKVARICNYEANRRNYAGLLDIPVRLREHADNLRKESDEAYEKLQSMEEAVLKTETVQAATRSAEQAQKAMDAKDAELAGLQDRIAELTDRKAVFASGEDEYLKKAIQRLGEELSREDLQRLRREAEQTPTQEDDEIIGQLSQLEDERSALGGILEQQQQALQSERRRHAELEQVRLRFRRSGYDRPGSAFGNSAFIGVMLGEFLRGVLDADSFWRNIQRHHRRQRRRANPVFGSGGFPAPRRTRVWRSGGWGGLGGGGLGGGGGFGSGGGFGGGGFKSGGGF